MKSVRKLFLFSVLAGLSTGLAVSFYVLLTKAFALAFYLGNPLETIPKLPFWYVAFITTSSILIVNLIIANNEKAREYGIREIAKALEENRITFSLGDLALKIVASAISIGSGFAVGNEGPSAAIGAMIAYRFHNLLKIPKKLLKVSIGVGASSGIAAVFVSPITGILFAVENVAYQLIRDFVGFMIMGSFSAFLAALIFLKPLVFEFSIGKSVKLDYVFSIFLFIPVITIGIYAYLLLRDRLLFYLNSLAQEKLSLYQRTVLISLIGGFTVALLLKTSPFTGFSGHEVVEELINGKFKIPLTTIFLLVLLRIVSNAVSLYSNAVGGLFITLMSIGALIGYGFGEGMGQFGFNVEPFYFAAIGAAVFVGVVMKIPFTAVVLALETTYDYNVVIPAGIVISVVGLLTNVAFNIRKGTLRRRE
ncbi:MAG: chloride channel protein [Thermovibrio sp.]|nr:MAG: chloride channel protein [Thermovibrio sp.]